MIEAVASRIAKERPNLPFFTIHDSVLTIEGEEAYLAYIIEEEVLKYTNLKVQLRIEK